MPDEIVQESIEEMLDRFGDWLIEEGFDYPTRDLPKRIATEIRQLREKLAIAESDRDRARECHMTMEAIYWKDWKSR